MFGERSEQYNQKKAQREDEALPKNSKAFFEGRRGLDMEFRFLTEQFYKDYCNCGEMEKKKLRPYAVLCIVNYRGLIFAIPIRHNIKHNYAVKTVNNQGLDLSKAVVIKNDKYIDNTKVAVINSIEYKILLSKEHFIEQKLKKYIKEYKKGLKNLSDSKYRNLCEKSCLQYFHAELKIE